MKFCKEIHGPQMMRPSDSSVSLSRAAMELNYCYFSEKSQELLDGFLGEFFPPFCGHKLPICALGEPVSCHVTLSSNKRIHICILAEGLS